MKIYFVTGKGGVGKSTVAAALAYKHSLQKEKTLLVEIGETSFYKAYFSLSDISFDAIEIRPYFSAAHWKAHACLKQYIHHLVKLESLSTLFFNNPVSKALLNVAPGLNELSILGKITSGPPRNVGPKMPFDCLVVDSYASGHFLSLLRAPIGLSLAIEIGPMGEQTRSILHTLQNENICQYYIVATPEDLAVTEGLELKQTLKNEFSISAQLILNELLQGSFQESIHLKPLLQRIEFQKHFQNKFDWHLPLVLSQDPWIILPELAEALP